MATLSVVPSDQRDDAIQLHKAFKGFGCDTGEVIRILAHRDATQRALLQQEFRQFYGEDLTKRVSSELSGHLETAVLLWLHDPVGRDAEILRQAFTIDHDLEAVTEVLCSRTPSQIQSLKQHYYSKFGNHVENEILRQTPSEDHKKMLLAWVAIPRYEGMEVDTVMAQIDVKDLYKAGEKRLGTDEKTFIRIFSERSGAHLAAVSSSYAHMYGNSLKEAVKKETSGVFRRALLTILQCAEHRAAYFAKVLHKSMKGLGTNDKTLIRVIVTRTEIDMVFIKAEYHKKYKKNLNDAVQSETSGHYQKFLLALLGPNH